MSELFDGLVPTPGAPRALVRYLHEPDHYDEGTQARVVFTSMTRVIKLTRCAASIALAHELASRGRPPQGLPRVHRVLGEAAVDTRERNAPHVGVVMERLWEPEDSPVLDEFLTAARKVVGSRNMGVSPTFDADIALRLAAADLCGTGEAFVWLARFLVRHGAVLDIFTDGNVLLDRRGNVCLADPVCEAPHDLGGRLARLEGDVLLRVRDEDGTAELLGSGLGRRLAGSGKNRWRAEGATHAVESMLMALAAAGIDLESDMAAEAVAVALQRISDGLQ
ncbi:MAG: hypothetical protein U1F53_20715 [Burkholderiaceae bacterium]